MTTVERHERLGDFLLGNYLNLSNLHASSSGNGVKLEEVIYAIKKSPIDLLTRYDLQKPIKLFIRPVAENPKVVRVFVENGIFLEGAKIGDGSDSEIFESDKGVGIKIPLGFGDLNLEFHIPYGENHERDLSGDGEEERDREDSEQSIFGYMRGKEREEEKRYIAHATR